MYRRNQLCLNQRTSKTKNNLVVSRMYDVYLNVCNMMLYIWTVSNNIYNNTFYSCFKKSIYISEFNYRKK